MKITIKARGNAKLSEELRELVERRVRYSLGRFGRDIARVVVTIEEGATSICRVSVRGRTLWHEIIRDEDPWIAVAVGRATSRAGHAVASRLNRQLSGRLASSQASEPAPIARLQEVPS